MLFQMKLLCSLIAKDWKLFLADRRAAVLCFVVPIVLASAFGMIFDRPSQHLGACKLPLAVVVEDESVFSSAIVTDLRASEHVEIRLVDRATAESSLNDRSASVALILPPLGVAAAFLAALGGSKAAVGALIIGAVLQQARVDIRRRIGMRVLAGDSAAALRREGWRAHLLQPAAHLMNLGLFLSSFAGRDVEWAGRRYRLSRHDSQVVSVQRRD